MASLDQNFPMLVLSLLQGSWCQEYVDVAILHSLTGTLAISEITVVQAEILAIEELNAAGGVLGKQIRYTLHDGQSSPSVFASKAQSITTNASIATTFGCWTSSSRKAVLPYYEGANKQLWYPVQYEGQECSKNVFYSGASPNEQIEPSIFWLLNQYPRNFYLLGSDYVFPRTANKIIKAMLDKLGGTVIDEQYVPLPADAQQSADNQIALSNYLDSLKTRMPQGCVIYNSLNGDANVQLFTLLQQKNMSAQMYPTMSVSITETEANVIGVDKLFGHFAAWNYFMPDPTTQPKTFTQTISQGFVKRFRSRFGNASLVNDPMEAAYINVYIWATAVDKAQSFDVDLVRQAAYGVTFDAPEGTVTLQTNHHLSKYARIGQFRADGLLDIVWANQNPVYPVPWNQYIPETTGKYCNWALSTNTSGSYYSQYSPPQINIALLYDPEQSKILQSQLLAIQKINTVLSGVLGNILVPNIVNINWDSTRIAQNLQNASAVFTPALNLTQDALLQSLSASYSKALVYVPSTVGQTNARNVFRFDLTVYQMLSRTLPWLSSFKIDAFFVVSDGSPKALEISKYVKSQWQTKYKFLGQANLTVMGENTLQIQQMIQTINQGQATRMVIINTLPGYSPSIGQLFSGFRNITAKVKILNTNLEEDQLVPIMQGSYTVSTYFESLLVPENQAFLTTYTGTYGTNKVTESMVQAYNAIMLWMNAVKQAQSLDLTKIRVAQYGLVQSSLSGNYQMEYSNRISCSYRIGKVVTDGSLAIYRFEMGIDDTNTALFVSPLKAVQGDPDYYGPVLIPEPLSSPGRIFTLSMAVIGCIFIIVLWFWVMYHQGMLVIRRAGIKFLTLTLLGSLLGITCVFCIYTIQRTPLSCRLQYWPQHVGFFLCFGSLLQKCMTVYAVNKKRSAKAKPVKANPIRNVAGLVLLIVTVLVAQYFVEQDVIETLHYTVENGVSYREFDICKHTPFGYGILVAELLTCIIGSVLAFQIRDVPHPSDEAMHMGEAVYVWAFTRIILEVVIEFAPYEHELFFQLQAWGEIIPNVHTAVIFVIPLWWRVRNGQGNDESYLNSRHRSRNQSTGAKSSHIANSIIKEGPDRNSLGKSSSEQDLLQQIELLKKEVQSLKEKNDLK
ncbi:periplasmic binding protein domain-containing protein [Gorgonomyces haynaldii]|nr:periplasmic binding protein domain-containing protein [Gorgonomyces haynaldii]